MYELKMIYTNIVKQKYLNCLKISLQNIFFLGNINWLHYLFSLSLLLFEIFSFNNNNSYYYYYYYYLNKSTCQA